MKETAMTNKSFMIWRAILIAGMVIGLAGLVGEMVWSADKGKSKGVEVISMATSAKITIVGAVERLWEASPGRSLWRNWRGGGTRPYGMSIS
jgi:hypothetical protein